MRTVLFATAVAILTTGCHDSSTDARRDASLDAADARDAAVSRDAAPSDAAAVHDAASWSGTCANVVAECAASGDNPVHRIYQNILDAKRACDSPREATCGILEVEVDADGCVQSFGIENMNPSAEYVACVLRELSAKRFPCVAGSKQESYESCTLL